MGLESFLVQRGQIKLLALSPQIVEPILYLTCDVRIVRTDVQLQIRIQPCTCEVR